MSRPSAPPAPHPPRPPRPPHPPQVLHLPLLAERDLAAPLAWRGGRAVSGHAFLAAAARLAQRLPASGRAINLCQDRLHFALGLAAALQRSQPSLMPPNALPATLRQLPAEGPPAYVLADAEPDADTAAVGGLPVVRVAFDASDAAAPASAPVPRIDADLDAVVLLTSGSTGAPQPHGKRFDALVCNIGAEAARLAEWLARPSLHGLAIVATVPPQHSYGLESSVLLALLGGASLDAARPFYPADIAAALAALPRPRALVTTPFHLKALVQSGVALPAVDLVLSATAPLSPQLAARAEAAMGARLGEIYGCTEAGQVAARLTTQGDLWTTLGEMRIRRELAGAARGGSDANEDEGERFVVSGGHVALPTPLADVLELHDERRFRLLGRANDLIHVAGKRSSLAHLNFHLNRIDGVEDGAFWLPEAGDLPEALAGSSELEAVHRPIAFVVAPHLTTQQVVTALRAELEPAFVPRRVVPVDALPREATGKLTAAALRAWAIATLGAPGEAGQRAAPPGAGEAGALPAQASQVRVPQLPQDLPAVVGHDVAECEFVIEASHRAFAGHFPGHPLLPGVVLLSLVMRSLRQQPVWRAWLGGAAAGDATTETSPASSTASSATATVRTATPRPPTIEQVKFLSPVGPGERVRVRFAPVARAVGAARAAIAFECIVRDGTGAAASAGARAGRHERVAARGVLSLPGTADAERAA